MNLNVMGSGGQIEDRRPTIWDFVQSMMQAREQPDMSPPQFRGGLTGNLMPNFTDAHRAWRYTDNPGALADALGRDALVAKEQPQWLNFQTNPQTAHEKNPTEITRRFPWWLKGLALDPTFLR